MIPVFFSALDLLKNIHEAEDYGESLEIQDLCKDLNNLSSKTEVVKTSRIESSETDSVNSEKEKSVDFNETNEDQVKLVIEKIEKETVVERDGSENIGKEVQKCG